MGHLLEDHGRAMTDHVDDKGSSLLKKVKEVLGPPSAGQLLQLLLQPHHHWGWLRLHYPLLLPPPDPHLVIIVTPAPPSCISALS